MNRMKASEFQAIAAARDQGKQGRGKTAPKANKYGAVRTTVGGLKFDSKAEAEHYGRLCLLENAGVIRDLRMQVPFTLEGRDGVLTSDAGTPLTYKADFVYFDVEQGRECIVDIKGKRTQVYRLKKAIMAAMGLEIDEVQV